MRPVSVKITLPQRIRIFSCSEGDQEGGRLFRTGKELPATTVIRIWSADFFQYDHREVEAVPFRYCGTLFYFLLEEIYDPLLKERIKRIEHFAIAA